MSVAVLALFATPLWYVWRSTIEQGRAELLQDDARRLADIFDKQDATYKNSVIPPSVTARVSVEAGSVFGWDRYVGPQGAIIGMTTATTQMIFTKLINTKFQSIALDLNRHPGIAQPRPGHTRVGRNFLRHLVEQAFDAHETATHTVQFRAATAQGGRAWRANLYDQRLYKVL